MPQPRSRPCPLRAAALLLAVAGCGSASGAEVNWTFADRAGPPDALACAERGVVAIRIEAFDEARQPVGPQDFPCAGGSARRGLEPGSYSLLVSGIDGLGRTFEDPATGGRGLSAEVAGLRVREDVFEPVDVTLPRVPRCANRIDDDGDGLVDQADPGCEGPAGDAEDGTGAP